MGTSMPSSMTFTTRFQIFQEIAGVMEKMLVNVIMSVKSPHRTMTVFKGGFFFWFVKGITDSVATASIRLRGMSLKVPQIRRCGAIRVSQVQPRMPVDGVRKVWIRIAISSGARNRSRMGYQRTFFLADFRSPCGLGGDCPNSAASFLGSGSMLPQNTTSTMRIHPRAK